MAQDCPVCGALVDDEGLHCAACGAEINPFKTIRPPKFNVGAAPPAPSRELGRDPAPPRPPAESPPAPRPRPKVRRTAPPSPIPASQSGVVPAPQAYAPAPVPPPPVYAPPAPAVEPAPAVPGRFRKKLIEMLGGKADARAAPAPPQNPLYPYTPPRTDPDQAPLPPPPAPPYYAPTPPAPRVESPAFVPPEPFADDGATRAMKGADLARLKVPSHLFTLQILDQDGQWQPWSTVGAGGLKVGRGERSARFPELNSLGTRHLKLGFDGRRLLAEDLGSLNGVYLKLNRPAELRDGMRFRVGSRIIEFHQADPLPPSPPLLAEDGEEFWSGDLRAFAYLDFIRPGGEPGLRFPVTNPDRTILGRESRPGKPVDVALPDDDWVSGQHAQVRREGERFFLEDLLSRNGTFVRTEGPTEVTSGDVLLVGRVLLRVVDASGR